MTQEKKLPPFLFSMQPHSWQRVEARKFSASAQTMMFHFVGFLFGFHKTEAKISYSILQEYSGLSRPTVIRACKELVDGGLITHRVENNISIFGVVFDEDEEFQKIQKRVNKEIITGKESLPDDNQEIITSKESLPEKPVTSKESLPPTSQNSLHIKEGRERSLKKGLGLSADFFDAVSFDFDKKVFDMTQEHEDKYTELYNKKIESLGLNMTEIYQDACKRVVERQNTKREVKNFGKWLDNFFKDASYGNVFKRGAQNKAEQKNFDTNYELFCSLEHYKDMKVSGIFLIVKGKEYNFYSAPEIFNEAFRDHEL
jgi:hypothetical protein